MKSFLFLAAIVIAATIVYCAGNQASASYQYPLHADKDLASNFGEVRRDHFHMGLDLRTMGQENIPVYAAENGYISRISVAEDGYGNALYITHSNGTTTLYGHLNKFVPGVQQYLRSKQSETKRWEQNIVLPRHQFDVHKDQLVAYSGNTGYSEGPHLHFEIMDTKTSKRLNPMRNGFAVADRISPTIHGIYWYNRLTSIYKTVARSISNGQPVDGQTFTLSSPVVGFGIEASDKNALTRYTFGINKAELYVDNVLRHRFLLDEIGQEETRYVNACVDYGKMTGSGKRIQYLFTLPGNHLKAFEASGLKGVLDISDGRSHQVKIIVYDVAGNEDANHFNIRYRPIPASPSIATNLKNAFWCPPNKPTVLQSRSAQLYFSKNAFYDTASLQISEQSASNNCAASPLIKIKSNDVPVHDHYMVAVSASVPEGNRMRNKVVLLLTYPGGQEVIKGYWKKSRMSARLNRLGNIQLLIDTTAPAIALTKAATKGGIRVVCNDNLGTISFFEGKLDGQWVPFAKKGNQFFYVPDRPDTRVVHQLVVIARDVAGNVSTKNITLFR